MQGKITELKEKRGLRKDFGDLRSLIDSIYKMGLINPITISKDGVIVAGRRRFRAWRVLHRRYPKSFGSMPPFTRHSLTYKEMVKLSKFNMFNMIQLHENTQRKDFTPEEISAIKDDIEKQRKSGKLPEAAGKDTRDVVADITGLSGKQVDKIDTIVKAAKRTAKAKKTLMKLNKGQISVDTAYWMVTKDARNLPKIDPPKGEFDLLYSDIPIGFNDDGGRGAASNHFPVEPPEYFFDIEIPAAKDAVIFFWIPSQFLIDGTATKILDNWGFYPKEHFVWDKGRIGMGRCARNQHENLIMAFKGIMPMPAVLYPTIIKAPRGEHSRKPDIVYEMMETMYPKRTMIELWHRGKPRKGWVTHGNESK